MSSVPWDVNCVYKGGASREGGGRQRIGCTHGIRRQVGWHIQETRTRRGRRRRGGRRYGDASDGCCWNVEVYECWIGKFALSVCRPLFLLLLFLAFGVLLVILIPRLCVQYNLLSRRRRVFRRRKPTLRSRPSTSSTNRLFLRIRRGRCSLRPGGRWSDFVLSIIDSTRSSTTLLCVASGVSRASASQ